MYSFVPNTRALRNARYAVFSVFQLFGLILVAWVVFGSCIVRFRRYEKDWVCDKHSYVKKLFSLRGRFIPYVRKLVRPSVSLLFIGS